MLFTLPSDMPFDYLDQLNSDRAIVFRINTSNKPSHFTKFTSTNEADNVLASNNVLQDWYKESTRNISVQDISEVTKMILSHDGLQRLHKFREYQDGWDFGRGSMLSLKSLSTMEYFVNQFYNFQVTPSIFMSHEGNLLLGWEDAAGKKIEVEFYPDSIGYYIENLDEEEEITLDATQIATLVNKLHRI